MQRFPVVAWKKLRKDPDPSEVCIFCKEAILAGDTVGHVPCPDEISIIRDFIWHKECRIEWLRELADDCMSEAERMELEDQNRTGVQK